MLKKSKIILSVCCLTVTLVVLSMTLHGNATSPPNLALPDLSGHCLGKGATFTTVITASNLTNTQSWQVNVTFTAGTIATMGYTFGNAFTGQNTISGVNNSTNAGRFLLGVSLYNGAGSVTTTNPITLVTITWKTLVYHPTVFFHLVTVAENPLSGTKLLGPSVNLQSYTTTDGFLGCQLRPSP